jgi:hypothetical protein
MKTIIQEIAAHNGSKWGVWRLPVTARRGVFGYRPVAVFGSQAEAEIFAQSLSEPNF